MMSRLMERTWSGSQAKGSLSLGLTALITAKSTSPQLHASHASSLSADLKP